MSIEKAEEFLAAADACLNLTYHNASASRSYYAMFHAATAVLLELDIERSSHHGVWAAFGQFVTAKGLMDAHYHHIGIEWFRARGDSDYFAEPDDTRDDARNAVAAARDFVAACRRFLERPESGGQP